MRKLGATRAADNGATEAELEAIFGWSRGSKQSAAYTRAADRKRLAARAGALLASAPIPAPSDRVRAEGEKR